MNYKSKSLIVVYEQIIMFISTKCFMMRNLDIIREMIIKQNNCAGNRHALPMYLIVVTRDNVYFADFLELHRNKF